MQLLLTIFAILFLAIIIIMSVFAHLAAKYQQMSANAKIEKINKSSPYRGNPPPPLRPTDKDYRSKDKVQEKRLEEELEMGVTKYMTKERVVEELNREDTQIVGVAEPVGFWSKFIMNQKLGFIVARMSIQNNNDKSGYWVNAIKAQAASQTKEQNKGR